jgi:hypothetical protein
VEDHVAPLAFVARHQFSPLAFRVWIQ